jgi:membrane fusion protein (multidrug efflux system)
MRIPLLLILGVVLGLAGCDEPAEKKADRGKAGKRQHLVEVVTVGAKPLRHETVRTGSLAARRSVRLFNQEEGRIDQLPVYEGAAVVKGQILVRLDRRLLMAQIEKATAARQLAEADLERIEKLAKKRITTQEKLDQAEMRHSVALAEETLVRTRLAYSEIAAPFDGIVTERKVEPGDVAPLHSHLLTLIDPNSLYTKISVSELMLPRLKEGDAAEVRIDALGDRIWTGRIRRIHPTIDPRTRQGVVEVAVEPVPPGAREGQLCRVTLRTPAIKRKVLPFAALRRDREGEYVYVVVDGKAKLQRVRTGLRLEDKVEALEGLDEGDKVIVRGFLDLRPGKPVTITDKNGKKAGQPGGKSPSS